MPPALPVLDPAEPAVPPALPIVVPAARALLPGSNTEVMMTELRPGATSGKPRARSVNPRAYRAAMTDTPGDDKDWTWVLERPCPECGFDAGALEVAQIPGSCGTTPQPGRTSWSGPRSRAASCRRVVAARVRVSRS